MKWAATAAPVPLSLSRQGPPAGGLHVPQGETMWPPAKFLRYYDRNYREIDLHTWARLYEDPSYRFLGDHFVASCRVVTIWDGGIMGAARMVPAVFYALENGLPLPTPPIFETMIFGLQGRQEGEFPCRYYSEESALDGHSWAIGWLMRQLPLGAVKMLPAGKTTL